MIYINYCMLLECFHINRFDKTFYFIIQNIFKIYIFRHFSNNIYMFYLKFSEKFIFLNNWFDWTNVYYIWSDTIDHRNQVWIRYHKFQCCKRDKKCHLTHLNKNVLFYNFLMIHFCRIIFRYFNKNDKTNIFKIDYFYTINLMVKFWEFKCFLVKNWIKSN